MKTTVNNKISVCLVFLLMAVVVGCEPDVILTPEQKLIADIHDKIEKKMKDIDDDTLLGPDKNSNGVRDDVEYWINHSPLILNNDVKNAALQYAKSQREVQKYAHDKPKSIRAMYELSDSHSCLTYILRETKHSMEELTIHKKLNVYMDNTKARVKAYYKSDVNFAGQGGATPNFASECCHFKFERKYFDKGSTYDQKK